ncbi:MAG: hypothetical protein Kow0092_36350 [Deferrisomatales bacterium]
MSGEGAEKPGCRGGGALSNPPRGAGIVEVGRGLRSRFARNGNAPLVTSGAPQGNLQTPMGMRPFADPPGGFRDRGSRERGAKKIHRGAAFGKGFFEAAKRIVEVKQRGIMVAQCCRCSPLETAPKRNGADGVERAYREPPGKARRRYATRSAGGGWL